MPTTTSLNLTQQIAQLAQEIEHTDPIDWGMLSIDEENAYMLMAGNILDMYLGMEPDHRDMMLLATTTKLTVENFVLNLKLLQKNKD
jgi:hypothetical protein